MPLERYILESVPESCRAVDMPNVGAVGDAKDIQTETVRASDQKLVKNQSYSDKMHSAAARGTTFTTGSGMTTIASQLYLARGSELNGIRSVRRELARYGRRLHFVYDKGVPGIRGVLPNYNFVHMPAFLAPASGKTKFEATEAVENRGTARARYVVEVSYARVTEWALLADVVPAEEFHLMNSVWLFALGFANLMHRFLQPPPDAETPVQAARRGARTMSDQASALGAAAQPAAVPPPAPASAPRTPPNRPLQHLVAWYDKQPAASRPPSLQQPLPAHWEAAQARAGGRGRGHGQARQPRPPAAAAPAAAPIAAPTAPPTAAPAAAPTAAPAAAPHSTISVSTN